MNEKFVIKPKNNIRKEDKSIIMTLRLNREIQEEFDKLAFKSNYSRNELMCMALKYALNHLKLIPNNVMNENHRE